MPTTASAAIAAGSPIPRPLAGSTGPATIPVAAGLGVTLGGSWIGPAGDTGGSMDPPGPGVDECLRWCGLGATCGPVLPALDWVGVGANDGVGVGVAVCDGDGAGDDRGPTVTEPWAVLGPLVAVIESRPDVVPTKLWLPDVDELGATCCE